MKRQILVGGKKQDFLKSRDDLIDIRQFTPIAVIGRTNFAVFKEIVKIACDPSNPPRCALNGGLASYDFDHLLDFYYLYSKQLHKMRRYKSFTNFEALKAFAKNINDIALMSKLKIVEVYKSDVPDIIEKIHTRCNYGPGYADYIFTTTHKAKGLEWKTVILLDDFW